MTDPVLSRDDHVWHQPDGSPRRYLLAPLTRRERNLFRRALVAEGASFPGDAAVFAALRRALHDIAPANLTELLTAVDAAEAELRDGPPGAATRALTPIEAAARAVPAFATLLADRDFYLATYPLVMARLALRGWEGEGMPAFERRNGVVPEALLEALPDAELISAGLRAHEMAFLSGDAGKNSAPPSPSSVNPTAGASR